MSQCFVTAADYARYWLNKPDGSAEVFYVYAGPDRRISGKADRRALRERRWESSSRGRRFRLADRRTR